MFVLCFTTVERSTIYLKIVCDKFPVLQAKKMLMMIFSHAVLMAAAIVLCYWLYICYRLFWDTVDVCWMLWSYLLLFFHFSVKYKTKDRT